MAIILSGESAMQTLQVQSGSTVRPFSALGVKTIELIPGVVMPCFMVKFGRNEEVFAEEDRSDYVYKVVSGAVRAVRVLSDGRRQIVAFHLPDDVFGMECGAEHRVSAEAVSDCEIALVRRSTLDAAAQADGEIAHSLWRATCEDMQRLQDHMLRLGRETALERVMSFLVEVSSRCANHGRIVLPMGRTDIADYLGLTLETVSRTLTQLQRAHAISMPSARCIQLHEGKVLAAA